MDEKCPECGAGPEFRKVISFRGGYSEEIRPTPEQLDRIRGELSKEQVATFEGKTLENFIVTCGGCGFQFGQATHIEDDTVN